MLNLFFLSLFILNGSQVLYVNLGCLKCISGMNWSHANKNLFIISFILISYYNGLFLDFSSLSIIIVNTLELQQFLSVIIFLMYQVRRILPIIFRNTSASWSLINPNFLQSHIAHFYESIALPFLPFQVLGFCFLYFSAHQIMRYCCFINRLKSSMNCRVCSERS